MNDGKRHVGDESLYETILKLKEKAPKYHIFGHIHDDYGITKEKNNNIDTIFINAAIVTEYYHPKNKPILFYLESKYEIDNLSKSEL